MARPSPSPPRFWWAGDLAPQPVLCAAKVAYVRQAVVAVLAVAQRDQVGAGEELPFGFYFKANKVELTPLVGGELKEMEVSWVVFGGG